MSSVIVGAALTSLLTCAAVNCSLLPSSCPRLCSPSGDVLAVGDITGRILLWHGIRGAMKARSAGSIANNAQGNAGGGAAEPRLPQATVHWHAEPVRCLAFTADGTYLLSGGASA